jgi:succinylglutamate desuccinylase/aspartoacylase family protein
MPRWLRVPAVCVAAVALWYVFSYHRDWFYFHFRSHTIARDLGAFEQSLRATGVPMGEAGRVQYAGSEWPIWVLRQPAAPSGNGPARTVCLMGSIHGNEPAGAEALLSLAQDMRARPRDFASFRWVLVPIANPWGWVRDLRHNGGNRDTARQFVSGHAQEAEWLKALFAQEHCDLLVDLHEDRLHHGFYALAYGDVAPQRIAQALREVATETGAELASRPEGGVWQVPASSFGSVRLTTASLWARMHGVPRALIVETPDSLPLATRVRIHRKAIEKFAALPPAS